MMTLITGGTGFIGARLAARCLERGEPVRVLAQTNTDAERAAAQAVRSRAAEVVLGSISDAAAVRQAVEGCARVYHFAAAQHEANVPDAHFHEVNVEGTRTLLDAAAAAGVRRVVHGSTIGVYGRLEGTIDETSPCRPDNIYGTTKLEGEKLALSRAAEVPVTAIRISETYGPGDRRLLKLFRAVDRGRFFMIGDGRNLHHPVHVDDLLDGMEAAAASEQATGEVFLLAGPEPVTSDQMVAAIARALDREPPRMHVPLAPFLAAAWVMETTLRPLGIQPPLHRRRMDFFRKSFTLSRDKAARVLGFEPRIGFGEGARGTAAWYRERGML